MIIQVDKPKVGDMLETFYSKYFLIVVAVCFGLVASLAWLPISLVIAVILLASVSVFRLGILTRLMVAAILYGVAGATILLFGSLLQLELSFVFITNILLVGAGTYALCRRDAIQFNTTVEDILGLCISGFIGIAIAFPLLKSTDSKTLEYLLSGEDNSSHFQMYRYILVKGKYAYNNTEAAAGIRPSLLSYAQGSHAAMATITAPFVRHSPANDQLKAYALSAAGVFSAVFWLGFLIISRPLVALKNRWHRTGANLAIAAVYAAVVPLGFLSLYAYGFYPQYFAYLGFMLLVLGVMCSSGEKIKGRKQLLSEAATVLVGFYTVFLSWYLLAPIAAIPLAFYAWNYRQALYRNKWPIAGLLIPFAVAMAYLSYIYLFKSTGASHILTTGGVEEIDPRSLWLCLPLVVSTAYAFRRKDWRLTALGFGALLAGIFTAIVGYYQMKKLGHYDYYFYKTFFTAILVTMLFYGYMLVQWIDNASMSGKLLIKHALQPLVGIFAVGLAISSLHPLDYFDHFATVRYSIPQHADNRVLDVFTHDVIYEKYDDIIALSHCNPYSNFTGTIWAGGYFFPYTIDRYLLEGYVLKETPKLANSSNILYAKITEYAATKQKPVAVTVGPECYTDTITSQLSNAKNVELITPEGKPLL